jgi:hypothetical protein
MKRILLSLAAAVAILSAASLLPTRANAMGVGTAAAIDGALVETSHLQEAQYYYRRRYRYYRPYTYYYRPRVYRSYRYYRPYRYRW